MPWTNLHTNLNYELAGLYMDVGEARRIAKSAGLNVIMLKLTGRPLTDWSEIIEKAENANKLNELIQAALTDYPDNIKLKEALEGKLTAIEGPTYADTGANADDWADIDLSENSFEALMGKEGTLLPISFLEMGMDKARSVAKIYLNPMESGTGFLIHNNILITNNHVINSAEAAKNCHAQFNYQNNKDGLALPVDSVQFDPDNGFATSDKFKDDWTAIKLARDANTKWGALELKPVELTKNERVTIIQHPGGSAKQIGMHHNFLKGFTDDKIQYLTDTEKGSSGSPVFNRKWEVVGLHHKGGKLPEVISKRKVYRNQGININKVIAGLKESGMYPN